MTLTRSTAPSERHTCTPPSSGSRGQDEDGHRRAARRWRTARPPAAEGLGIRIGSRRISVSTLLLLDVVLLCLIGLVMVGSASSVISIATYGSPWAILIREVMWMAIGAVALWLAVRFDYRKLRRFSPLIMLVTIGLLFVVLVPGLGVHAMGSSRWVGFGQFRLQPSELMKLALTLVRRRLHHPPPRRGRRRPPHHRPAPHRHRLRLRPDPGPAGHGDGHGPRCSSRSPCCSCRASVSGPS